MKSASLPPKHHSELQAVFTSTQSLHENPAQLRKTDPSTEFSPRTFADFGRGLRSRKHPKSLHRLPNQIISTRYWRLDRAMSHRNPSPAGAASHRIMQSFSPVCRTAFISPSLLCLCALRDRRLQARSNFDGSDACGALLTLKESRNDQRTWICESSIGRATRHKRKVR